MAHLQASRLGLVLPDADGKTWPVWDFDLSVVDGATLAIVGGRPGLASALLQILSGERPPQFGCVLLDGREYGAADTRVTVARRRYPGWGWQRVDRRVSQAVRDGTARKLSRVEVARWTRHNLQLVDLEDLAGRRLRGLSAGALARVELARALATEAPVLCLDHLFDGLSGTARNQCVDALLDLQARLTRSLIVATDDLEQAVLFADRVLCLDGVDGRIVTREFDVDLLRPRARPDLARDPAARRLLDSLYKRNEAGAIGAVPEMARPETSVVVMSEWVDARPTAGGKRIEKPAVTLGFLPLIDCAPLAIALEEGFFKAAGLSVSLSRESSWRNVEDKVALGLLDGAQMLAAMPLAARLDPNATPIISAMSLGRNGNGITVSRSLFDRLGLFANTAIEASTAAWALGREVARRRDRRERRIVFGMVAPHSSHNYLLRYWLACGGIDPDQDVELVVVPPSEMVAYLAAGMIDGFCVGEPWNTVAADEGVGRPLLATWQVWNNHPEKVLGVSRMWAEAHPNTHLALVKALLDACWWLDKPDNRAVACEILSQGRYVNLAPEILERSLAGDDVFNARQVFHSGAANFPWHSHAAWLLSQMVRWGQVSLPPEASALCAATYRTDLYREASAYGDALPEGDWKPEGSHAGEWRWRDDPKALLLGPDRFMDGRVFADMDLSAYLAGFDIQAPAAKAAHAA